MKTDHDAHCIVFMTRQTAEARIDETIPIYLFFNKKKNDYWCMIQLAYW